jgi:hypothetical protein
MIKIQIYRFMLLNKAKEQQVLNFYNEEEDLLETMDDFLNYIQKNIKEYTDVQRKLRTFGLNGKQIKKEDQRIISGYFDSAYTGEQGKIKDRITNKIKYDLEKNDLFSKDFFFLINVPKNSKFGFLIVQRKENHGIKSIFESAFNSFMRAKGVSNFSLILKQAPPRFFLQNFLKNGRLKEFKLIESDVSEEFSENKFNFGKEERIFKVDKKSNASIILKNVLSELYNSFNNEAEKIHFLNKGKFEEITFVLEYKGTTKTFYIRNKEKIRSNIDISNQIEYVNGEPSNESMIKIALEILKVA